MTINANTKHCQGCKEEFSVINVILDKETLEIEKYLCDTCLEKEVVDTNKSQISKVISEDFFNSLIP